MHVVVATEPTEPLGMNPAPQAEGLPLRLPTDRHAELVSTNVVLGPTTVLHVVLTGRQQDRLTAVAVDLVVKEEVGLEPTGLQGINATTSVAKYERGRRRLAVMVDEVENDLHRRHALEEKVHLTSKSQVLRSLSDVEPQLCLPLARIARVELHDTVLEIESGERLVERSPVEHVKVRPPLTDLAR